MELSVRSLLHLHERIRSQSLSSWVVKIPGKRQIIKGTQNLQKNVRGPPCVSGNTASV